MGDIKDGFAFADGKGLLVNVAVGNLPEDIVAADGMVEEIFASLQTPLWMASSIHLESGGATDYAILLQQAGYHSAGCSVRQVDKYGLGSKAFVGALEGKPHPGCDAHNAEHNQYRNDCSSSSQFSPTPLRGPDKCPSLTILPCLASFIELCGPDES